MKLTVCSSPKITMFHLMLGSIVLLLDRITKWYAIRYYSSEYIVNKYLLFELSYNRGVSWSLFHSEHAVQYAVLTLVIGAVIIGFLWYWAHSVMACTQRLYKIGCTLVLAGAVSNFIDRLVYHGVVDFIVMHYAIWYWPAFNIADAAIVLGVILMLVWAHDK